MIKQTIKDFGFPSFVGAWTGYVIYLETSFISLAVLFGFLFGSNYVIYEMLKDLNNRTR